MSILESFREFITLYAMQAMPGGTGMFGVRPRVWVSSVAIVVAAILFSLPDHSPPHEEQDDPLYRFTKADRMTSALKTIVPSKSSDPRDDLSKPPPYQTGASVSDFRENEPVSVLLNELFSPDPAVRQTAAALLSRRSVYASDAVPILKKAYRDELDPHVRAAMREAIINIRGYAPPPRDF